MIKNACPTEFSAAYVYDKGLTDFSLFEASGVFLLTPVKRLNGQIVVDDAVNIQNTNLSRVRILVRMGDG